MTKFPFGLGRWHGIAILFLGSQQGLYSL